MSWWETPELLVKLWRNEEAIGRTYQRWHIHTDEFAGKFPLKGEYPEGVKLRTLIRKSRREAACRRRERLKD